MKANLVVFLLYACIVAMLAIPVLWAYSVVTTCGWKDKYCPTIEFD